MQLGPCTGDRDVGESALFFELFGRVAVDAAIREDLFFHAGEAHRMKL